MIGICPAQFSPIKYSLSGNITKMDCFYSFVDMLRQYELEGWKRAGTKYGFRLFPPASFGTGSIEVWGDPKTHSFIDSDVVFHTELVERYYYRERGIQMSFIDDMNVTYYRKKSEKAFAIPGMYVYVNNVPRPWFKRFLPGYVQKVSTILVMESFFCSVGLHYADEDWDRAAIAINNNDLPFPEIALLCKQLKSLNVPRREFDRHFRQKVVEAVRHIFDYARSPGAEAAERLNPKSVDSARRAIEILNEDYAYPPDVETLSKMVNIDKKTLQKAFRRIVGRTVGEHLRSIRMEKALALLEDKQVPIEEISRSVGYLSKVNFYKSFKRVFDCRPHEIRRVIRGISPRG